MRENGIWQWIVGSSLVHGVALIMLINIFTAPRVNIKAERVFIIEPSIAPLQGSAQRMRDDKEAVKSSRSGRVHQPQMAHQYRDSSPSKPSHSESSDVFQPGRNPVTEPAHIVPLSATAGGVRNAVPNYSSGTHALEEGAGSVPSLASPERSGTFGDMLLGDTGAPRFIHREAPIYPFPARKLGKQGKVLLRLTLDERGLLQGIDIVEKDGFGFTEAACAAIKKSTFTPAFKNGKAVSSRVLVAVRFVLREDK